MKDPETETLIALITDPDAPTALELGFGGNCALSFSASNGGRGTDRIWSSPLAGRAQAGRF